MSDYNINNMNFKQLKDEVQLLRDELALMKRKYEDIIYNLDTDNFSSRFVKEQDKMKTAIEVTAEGIKTMVSKDELNATSESILSQTAENITSTVKKEFETNLNEGNYVTNTTLESKIEQSASDINLSVSETYELKNDASNKYSELSGSISELNITSGSISTKVKNLENFKSSTFTQTQDGFTLDGEKTTFTGVIFITDRTPEKNKRCSFFYTTSQGYEQIIIGSCTGVSLPIVIGEQENVYIGSYNNDNIIATQGWVRDNAGIGGTVVAKFG